MRHSCYSNVKMRTTLNIEENALFAIRKYAEERGISLGQAASDLVHRGAESLPQFKTENGWVVFELPPGTPPLTNEMLEEWEKAEHEESHRRAFSPTRRPIDNLYSAAPTPNPMRNGEMGCQKV